MRNLARFLGPPVAVAILLGSGAQADDQPAATRVPDEQREDYLRLYGVLAEAVAQIELNSVAPVQREKLFAAALDGMMSQLDEYSSYLPPAEFERLQQLAKHTRPGLGLELAIEQGRIVVLGVHAASPAAVAGITPGDQLLSIDGESTRAMTLSGAEMAIAQRPRGVTIELQPRVGASRVLTLEPANLAAPSVVDARVMDQAMGYARIDRFAGDTPAELKSAIADLLQQGAKGLVIDLRYNSGGLLQSAIDAADLVLDKGLIVSVAPHSRQRREWQATPGDQLEGKPLVVLVNRYSASGSEVLASALQDNRRAKVVGERTWGKGSVQSIIPLGDGSSALKLTTARYLRPNGQSIHRFAGMSEADTWGVLPDEGYEVSLEGSVDRELLAAFREGKTLPSEDAQLQRAMRAVAEELTP